MSISNRIAHALAESALPHDQCQACERRGLPILPLRRALVPDLRPAYCASLTAGTKVETRMGLRTLRMGYLYVLLDRTIWHAFEVTEQGHLRRFNPVEPPPGPPPSLAEKCLGENHDIPSAFLNIDTTAHQTAWIAFASDAWPASVLNAYKESRHPPERFQVLELTLARINPASVSGGIVMTPGSLQVDKQVFEYAQQLPGTFDSAHGFHSRFLRQTATRSHVINTIAKHNLEQGVLALILEDPVGLVQEYNHARLSWMARRQEWREDPLRAYKLQTSQILLTIRAMQKEWAQQQTATFEPQTGDGPPVFVDPKVERQREIDRKVKDREERLEQRYNEPLRTAFQAEYDREEAIYQSYIDQSAKAYADLCDSAAFKLIEQYDYDGHDHESGVAYSKTMALCIAGGITEALNTEPRAPTLGSSEALWHRWLQNPDSPPYRAVLARHPTLMAGLLPSFFGTEATNLNDSEKLYSALSKVVSSDDLGLRLRKSLKQAIAESQGAVNAASQRLQPVLAPAVRRVVMRLNSASQWLYNGVQLIEFQVKMKLSEYYALQSAYLRELQHKVNAAFADARDRMHHSLGELEKQTQQNMRKVRPIIQNGLLSLAVIDPKLSNAMIVVSVWVEGTAREVHNRLLTAAAVGVDELTHAAQVGLINLEVALGTLQPDARKLLQGMRISAQQGADLVRTSFTGLRGAAGSWELLLSLGSFYLISDSLEKNLKKAEAEIGDKSQEAIMALHGSRMAILGGGIEAVGLVVKGGAARIAASSYLSTSGVNSARRAVGTGMSLARTGAVIGAVAGIYDAGQAGFAAKRTFVAGDNKSSYLYVASTTFYAAGAYFSYLAVSSAFLLGPLGIAIALSLGAYGLGKWAEAKESSPMETWARRCYFGKHNESVAIHWDRPEHADIAFAELNAATIGLKISINFHVRNIEPALIAKIGRIDAFIPVKHIRFRIIFPRFCAASSGFNWALIVHRHGDGQAPSYVAGEVISSGDFYPSYNSITASMVDSLLPSKTPKLPDYKQHEIVINEADRTVQANGSESQIHREIDGSIELTPDAGKHNIAAVTLSVTYWPDRNTPEAFAEVITQVTNK